MFHEVVGLEFWLLCKNDRLHGDEGIAAPPPMQVMGPSSLSLQKAQAPTPATWGLGMGLVGATTKYHVDMRALPSQNHGHSIQTGRASRTVIHCQQV